MSESEKIRARMRGIQAQSPYSAIVVSMVSLIYMTDDRINVPDPTPF